MGELTDRVAELRDRPSPSPNAGGVYQAGVDAGRLWEAVLAIAAALDVLVEGTGRRPVEG